MPQKNNDKKVLKSGSADIDNQIANHLPIDLYIKLRSLFLEKLGYDIDSILKRTNKIIIKILKRNSIADIYEYEILKDAVDTNSLESEWNKLASTLLLKFDLKQKFLGNVSE